GYKLLDARAIVRVSAADNRPDCADESECRVDARNSATTGPVETGCCVVAAAARNGSNRRGPHASATVCKPACHLAGEAVDGRSRVVDTSADRRGYQESDVGERRGDAPGRGCKIFWRHPSE